VEGRDQRPFLPTDKKDRREKLEEGERHKLQEKSSLADLKRSLVGHYLIPPREYQKGMRGCASAQC